MYPSTKSFFREARSSPHGTLRETLHGYVYLRWVYFYIAVATGEHRLARIMQPLFDLIDRLLLNEGKSPRGGNGTGGVGKRITFADTYHGKVVPLESATQLVSVREDISLPNLEKVVPYMLARDIVLKNPDHIAVIDCPCRVSRKNPCKPLDVCLIVGEPFASFALEHRPDRARRITSAEAVDILQAEDGRGHVHHAFFKDAMLGRFYALCNCCSCCCGAMQAHNNGIPMLASSGYIARVDDDQCQGCGDCESYCQFEALGVTDEKNRIDEGRCMGCGVCVSKCPHDALSLVRDSTRGEPLEIEKLMEEALAN